MRYLFLLALFIANPVFAAMTNIFEPASNDVSLKILNQLFGGLFNLGNGNDVFGSSMQIYIGAILAIGGLLAAYTVLAGTLGTAHDGEMLGKKFSSVWIPIRYSVGTALVIPISSGGYCGMQFIVAWCITQGIGLSGMVWSSYMSHPSQSANVSTSTVGQQEVLNTVLNAFTASVCVHGYQAFIDSSDKTLGFKDKYVFERSVDSNGNYHYGYSGSVVSSNVCGFMGNSSDKLVKNVSSQIPDHSSVASNNSGYLGNLDNIFIPIDITPINAVKESELKKLADRVDTLAIQAVADKDIRKNAQAYYSSLEEIAKAYISAVEQAGRNIEQPKEVKEQSAGWMVAGNYFNNIILSNNSIHKAINSFPSSRGSKTLHFNNIPDEDVLPYLVANEVLNASGSKAVNGASIDAKSDGVSGGNDSGFGVSASIGNMLAESVTDINLKELKNDTRHPVIVVNEMGNQMLQSYATITALTAVANFAAAFTKELATGDVATVATLGAAKGVGATASGTLAALGALGQFLLIPLTALLVIGFVCAYLIPFIPFIFWLACVGGFFIQTIMALLVAPLWAIMHLHPNGDDLTGKGGDGYSLLLGLLLRPTFLVFGFIASIALSSVFGEYINKTFFSLMAFSGANINGWFAFLTMIFGIGIYSVVMFAFIKTTHSLMYIIPDEIMKWIGGGKESLGNQAREMVGSVERGGNTATGAMVGGFIGSKGAGNGKGLGLDLGKSVGSYMKDKANTPQANQPAINSVVPGNTPANDNTAFNSEFGASASEKKEQALGFATPNGFTEHAKSAKYDTAMKSVKESKGLEGVESYQNEVIKYAKEGNALNETVFNNIAESVKTS